MSKRDVYRPTSDADRKSVLSYTQAILTRVGDVIGSDVHFRSRDKRIRAMLSGFSVDKGRAIELDYVARHFRDADVRASLGVTKDNEGRIFSRLRCLIKAVGILR